MFSVAALLDRAMKNARIESHYRLAKVIGVSQGTMGGYKSGKTMPDERVLEQLCALSGDDVAVMAAEIQAERARTQEGKAMWLMIAKRLAGGVSTAILSVLFAIGLIAEPVDSVRAGEVPAFQKAAIDKLYIVSSAILSAHTFLLVRLRCRWQPIMRLAALCTI